MRSTVLLACFSALQLACGARSELIAPTRDAALDVTAVDGDAHARCESDRDCDDRIDCTTDRCVLSTGQCAHSPDDRRCDDAQFCTGVERCVLDRGCVTMPVQCADAISCTK